MRFPSLVEAVRDERERAYYERTLDLAKAPGFKEPQRYHHNAKGRAPYLTAEQQAEVIALRRQRVSVRDLMDRFGVSNEVIRGVLRPAGLSTLPPAVEAAEAEAFNRRAMRALPRDWAVQGVQDRANKSTQRASQCPPGRITVVDCPEK